MSRHRETRHRGAGRRHELRPLSSGSRPRRRNRAARHAAPVTIEWDSKGTFRIVATGGDGEPAVMAGAELTEAQRAALTDVALLPGPGPVTAAPAPPVIWGPAFFWLWPRPPRPWVQPFPHRRGHSSRPGSSRRRRV
jgi:hypothetical protein